jgi:hypothetical protein
VPWYQPAKWTTLEQLSDFISRHWGVIGRLSEVPGGRLPEFPAIHEAIAPHRRFVQVVESDNATLLHVMKTELKATLEAMAAGEQVRGDLRAEPRAAVQVHRGRGALRAGVVPDTRGSQLRRADHPVREARAGRSA